MQHLSLQNTVNGIILSLDGSIIAEGGVGVQGNATGILCNASYKLMNNQNYSDISININIINTNSTPVSNLVITLSQFNFANSPTGTMQAWHPTYLAAEDCMWPSELSPLGCPSCGDGNYWISAWSPSECNGRYLIQGAFANNILGNPLILELHTTQSIKTNASIDFSVVIRVAKTNDPSILLSGWKDLLPTATYTGDHRSCIAANSVDSFWVTPTNPGGYNGEYRNLQDSIAAQNYSNLAVTCMKKENCQAVIFWAPGGFQIGNWYPTSFDTNLQIIKETWPLVTKTLNINFNTGICARLGQPDSISRIPYVSSTGVTRWYFDSSGGDWTTIQQIIQIRQLLGSNHQFFSEKTTDLTMRYSGNYCEWNGTSTAWFSELTRSHLTYLNSDCPWLCVDRSNTLNTIASFTKLGLIPFFHDSSMWNGFIS